MIRAVLLSLAFISSTAWAGFMTVGNTESTPRIDIAPKPNPKDSWTTIAKNWTPGIRATMFHWMTIGFMKKTNNYREKG